MITAHETFKQINLCMIEFCKMCHTLLSKAQDWDNENSVFLKRAQELQQDGTSNKTTFLALSYVRPSNVLKRILLRDEYHQNSAVHIHLALGESSIREI